MEEEKLQRIEEEVRCLRRKLANIHDRELISLVRQLGRERSNRGKEPTFISDLIPGPAITIPAHGVVKKGTARNILRQIEADIFFLREQITHKTGADDDHA
jgi:hypothetical protein